MSSFRRVCVFLGSSTGTNPTNTAVTIEMAETLLERGTALVYGGSDSGLMGLLADTVLEGGGEVIGVIPRNLFTREVAHRGLTELIEVDGMHERKARMVELSDAFVALPGGLGTLDELAEVATWRQIGIHHKPVGVVDADGYFASLLAWMDRVVDDGLLSIDNRALIHRAVTPAELLDALEADDRPATPKWD
jgi:uncharacterized protein (TIGR00730 family)